MPTIFVRCMLFISSYFPLTVILFILFANQQLVLALVFLSIGVIGLAFTYAYFWIIAPRMTAIQAKITERQEKEGDVMGYVASYLVPFVTLPLNGWQQISTLLIFILVLGIIYVKSSMIRINPMLSILGYSLYDVTFENDSDSYSLFTRRRIKRGETVRIVDVGRGIFLEKTV
jgi:hypothetical protein